MDLCAGPLVQTYRQHLLAKLCLVCDTNEDGVLTFGEFHLFLESLGESWIPSRIEFLRYCACEGWQFRAGACQSDIQDLVADDVPWYLLWTSLRNALTFLFENSAYRFNVYSDLAERVACRIYFPERRLLRLLHRPDIIQIADALGVREWWAADLDENDGGAVILRNIAASILSSMVDRQNQCLLAVMPLGLSVVHIMPASAVESVIMTRRGDISIAASQKMNPSNSVSSVSKTASHTDVGSRIKYWRVVSSNALVQGRPFTNSSELRRLQKNDIFQGRCISFGSGWRGELFVGCPEGDWIELPHGTGWVHMARKFSGWYDVAILKELAEEDVVEVFFPPCELNNDCQDGLTYLFHLNQGRLQMYFNGSLQLERITALEFMQDGVEVHGWSVDLNEASNKSFLDQLKILQGRLVTPGCIAFHNMWAVEGVLELEAYGLTEEFGSPAAGDPVTMEQYYMLVNYDSDMDLWQVFKEEGMIHDPTVPLHPGADLHAAASSVSVSSPPAECSYDASCDSGSEVSVELAEELGWGQICLSPRGAEPASSAQLQPLSPAHPYLPAEAKFFYIDVARAVEVYRVDALDMVYYVQCFVPQALLVGRQTGFVNPAPGPISFMGLTLQDGRPKSLHDFLRCRGFDVTESPAKIKHAKVSRYRTGQMGCGLEARVDPNIRRQEVPATVASGMPESPNNCHAKVCTGTVTRQCMHARMGDQYFCSVHLDPVKRPWGNFLLYPPDSNHYHIEELKSRVAAADAIDGRCVAQVEAAGWLRQCRRAPSSGSLYCYVHGGTRASSAPCSVASQPSKRRRRTIVERWYTHARFESYMQQGNVHNVDMLTDDAFEVILAKVHRYYMQHPKQREKLQANQGPADATERRSVRYWYGAATADWWYSRIAMFRRALALDLPGVDAMTDVQFRKALRDVHRYYMMNGAYRKRDQLQPNCGPRNAAERFSMKAHYVGQPRRFAFYDSSLFYALCPRPFAFGEVFVEKALRKVCCFMHRFDFCRAMRQEDKYCGPQCWSEIAGPKSGFRLNVQAPLPCQPLQLFQPGSAFQVGGRVRDNANSEPSLWALLDMAVARRRKRGHAKAFKVLSSGARRKWTSRKRPVRMNTERIHCVS